jgi:hypothetical protein
VKRRSWTVLGLAVVLAAPGAAPACSLCNPNIQQTATFRQDAAQSRMILYGTVLKSSLTGGGGGGVSDFQIKTVLKSDPYLRGKTTLEIPRYVPVERGDPPRYLLFCDLYQGKPDIFRGIPVKSEAAAAYVKGLLAREGQGHVAVLRYCFDYLDHPEREVANDAFLEFAKATDQDMGQVAPQLSADKLRGWLKDPQTPENRLGVYALLLGACGGEADAALLRAMVQRPTERTRAALDGLLGGYVQLRPREGWELALAVLKDERQPFATRFAVVRMLRFYHGWKPQETRAKVLEGLAVVLGQSDAADLAVEDLRRWQTWDLTDGVLKLYGRKGFDAPLMQRAIVRYALSCPQPEAARFTADLRRRDPELVKDVEEALGFEKR